MFLVHNLDIGGAQRAMATLASALVGAGWRSIVCPWRRTGPLARVLSEAGVTVEIPRRGEAWPRRDVPRFLRGVLRRTDAAIVHAHMSDAAIVAAGLTLTTGTPLVVTHHSPDVLDLGGQAGALTRRTRMPLFRWAVHRAAANVAVSDEVARNVVTATGLDRSRMQIIANGIPIPASAAVEEAGRRRATRAAARFDAGGPTIVAASRLAPEKGLETLVAALPLIRREFPGARLVLAGSGPMEGALRSQVTAVGLDAHVTFAGVVEDVPAMLRDADVFASPSRLEGTPLAVLEAMALGVPVVASDVPGHAALMMRGRHGLLVEVDRPDALAAAIAETLRDASRTDARTIEARLHVAARYDAAAMATEYQRLYQAILGRGART